MHPFAIHGDIEANDASDGPFGYDRVIDGGALENHFAFAFEFYLEKGAFTDDRRHATKQGGEGFDRFASLDFPDGIVAWTTVRNLAKSVGEDIYKRPYITVGFTALMTLVPLAATSTAGMIRRLGGRRWNLLHRLVYVTGVLAVVHYWWLVKSDISRPMAYGIVVALLLGFRIYWSWWRTKSAPAPARATA